jgi:hypothetical protein
MIHSETIYEAARLHAALEAANVAIGGVSVGPSGTTVHCSDAQNGAVQSFLTSYVEAPAQAQPNAEERMAALEAAMLDLLLGGM